MAQTTDPDLDEGTAVDPAKDAETVSGPSFEEPEDESPAVSDDSGDGPGDGSADDGDDDGGGDDGEGPDDASGGAEPEAPERNVLGLTALVVALVAALCAGFFGWSWYAAAHDDDAKFSQLRQQVLQSGSQAVQNLNTLDYRAVDSGLRLWQDSATSELYNQIVAGREEFVTQVANAKTATTATVMEAALTDLDEHAGRARIIVAVRVKVVPAEGDPVVKQYRQVAELTRTQAGWRLSSLGQAPAGS